MAGKFANISLLKTKCFNETAVYCLRINFLWVFIHKILTYLKNGVSIEWIYSHDFLAKLSFIFSRPVQFSAAKIFVRIVL